MTNDHMHTVPCSTSVASNCTLNAGGVQSFPFCWSQCEHTAFIHFTMYDHVWVLFNPADHVLVLTCGDIRIQLHSIRF